jgi:transposase
VGHPGQTLRMVETPDEVVCHKVLICPECQHDLRAVAVDGVEKRQVFDLPRVRLQVTEHQVERKRCPCCGQEAKAAFPPSVSQPTQYGEQIKGLVVYLSGYHLLPVARICELVSDCYGQRISQGMVLAALEESAAAVQPSLAAIESGLLQAAVAHADETGMRVAGQTQWLHVFSTTALTRYGVHAKRGQVALNELGLVGRFSGQLVHDGWNAYHTFSQCGHALCNAHLLRELTFLVEQHRQGWAQQMKELLLEVKAAVAQACSTGATELSQTQRLAFTRRYQQGVEQGFADNPPPETPVGKRRVAQTPARKLLKRLAQYAWEVLAFMRDFRVPFDNNLAERDLRMMKVKQKVAGCFRTVRGADLFAGLRSYLSTARKQGQPLLQALTQALLGTPFIPSTLAG